MIDKDIIKSIGDKEMDRKDFLKYSGLALLSVVGLKSIATILKDADKPTIKNDNQKVGRGFGGGRYGV